MALLTLLLHRGPSLPGALHAHNLGSPVQHLVLWTVTCAQSAHCQSKKQQLVITSCLRAVGKKGSTAILTIAALTWLRRQADDMAMALREQVTSAIVSHANLLKTKAWSARELGRLRHMQGNRSDLDLSFNRKSVCMLRPLKQSRSCRMLQQLLTCVVQLVPWNCAS